MTRSKNGLTNTGRRNKKAFQAFLLPASDLTVSPDRALNFRTMAYEPSWLYEGGFQFKKHYFGKPGELAETTPGGHLRKNLNVPNLSMGWPK